MPFPLTVFAIIQFGLLLLEEYILLIVLSIAILWNITPYSLFTLLKNTTLINKQKEKSFDDDAEEKTYPDLNLEDELVSEPIERDENELESSKISDDNISMEVRIITLV